MDENKKIKIKEGFLLRTLAEKNIVVPTGTATLDFNGMITLNETGAFLWNIIERTSTYDELVLLLCREYDIEEEEAKEDVLDFITQLQEENLLE